MSARFSSMRPRIAGSTCSGPDVGEARHAGEVEQGLALGWKWKWTEMDVLSCIFDLVCSVPAAGQGGYSAAKRRRAPRTTPAAA